VLTTGAGGKEGGLAAVWEYIRSSGTERRHDVDEEGNGVDANDGGDKACRDGV
jgi:hypothetical protein